MRQGVGLHKNRPGAHLLRLRQRTRHPHRQRAAARSQVGPGAAGQLRGRPGRLLHKVYHELRLRPRDEHAGPDCTGR